MATAIRSPISKWTLETSAMLSLMTSASQTLAAARAADVGQRLSVVGTHLTHTVLALECSMVSITIAVMAAMVGRKAYDKATRANRCPNFYYSMYIF